jgi:glycine cleavage system H protein
MKYTEDHAWLLPEGDVIVVGITEHGARELGDVVYVELPELETQVAKGDEIVEVNAALAENPALVNEDPMGEAWVFKIRVEDIGALDEYLTEDEYQDLVGE